MVRERPTSPRGAGRPTDGRDVRGALVAAALRQLGETGDPASVTVAAIVADVGCTPPTLYHYWSTREALLREASAVGFAAFRRSQADSVARLTDPLERIRSRGRAYLSFALGQESLFRVLFLDRPIPGRAPVRAEDPGLALGDLVADVAAAMDARQLHRGDPLATGLALWAAVHGVATLWLVTPDIPPELAFAVFESQTAALLAGLGEGGE